MMLTQTFLRATLQALSLVFGGFGIFFLWASFYSPPLASYTIFFLTSATALTFALPKLKG